MQQASAGKARRINRLRSTVADTLLGPPFARRLVITHGIDDIADSMVNISLVGSLFINVSFSASKSRILMYLVLTAIPLALIAPLISRILDRTRYGYRVGIAGTQLFRIFLALGMAVSLKTMALYPLTFGVLLCRKAYALTKTALLTRLSNDPQELVRASGCIGRSGVMLGAVGNAVGGGIYLMFGPSPLLVTAACVYAVSFLISLSLPNPAKIKSAVTSRIRGQLGDIPADLWVATIAVSVLRASAGALTYLLAFAIKRGGNDRWVFVAALFAAGAGGFIATFIAPRLLRMFDANRIIALLLLFPGVVTLINFGAANKTGLIAIAFSIGLSNSVATRTVDLLRSRTPALARGRVVARSELQFQLANVLGAVMAVWLTPTPTHGFLVVAAVLLIATAMYASRLRMSIRSEFARAVLGDQAPATGSVLPLALLKESERLAGLGAYRMAVVVADSAVRVIRKRDMLDSGDAAWAAWERLRPMVEQVVHNDTPPGSSTVLAVQSAARDVVNHSVTEHPIAESDDDLDEEPLSLP
ncbi:MAG TPA: hypothetical protein PKV27_01350 [Ilumatobacteraceae bacterium]|nr:hypothetical protein [Ilumatobacteraceae bacterium]